MMPVYVLGEALMDCIVQPDGQLKPLMGGSPYNMARAAALRGAQVSFLNPFSSDHFGVALRAQVHADGVKTGGAQSPCPTSLAVVNILDGGQPSYGFYREGIADRDYSAADMLDWLAQQPRGVLHTGSLLLIPPEDRKTLQVLQGAKAMGFIISVDVNLRTMVARDLDTYVKGVQEIAAVADWLKASDEDLLDLKRVSDEPALAQADDLAAPWLAQGVSRLALTFGSQGAALYVDGARVPRRGQGWITAIGGVADLTAGVAELKRQPRAAGEELAIVPQQRRRQLVGRLCMDAGHQGHAGHAGHAAAPTPPEGTRVRFADVLLTDQHERQVRLGDEVVDDRIVVMGFVYTSCTTVCPVVSAIMQKVQMQLGERAGREVQLVSISVDPLRDTPARLREYASLYKAGPGWTWLTGPCRRSTTPSRGWAPGAPTSRTTRR